MASWFLQSCINKKDITSGSNNTCKCKLNSTSVWSFLHLLSATPTPCALRSWTNKVSNTWWVVRGSSGIKALVTKREVRWCCLIRKFEISASAEVTEELLELISKPRAHKLWSKCAMNKYELCKLCGEYRMYRDQTICWLGCRRTDHMATHNIVDSLWFSTDGSQLHFISDIIYFIL